MGVKLHLDQVAWRDVEGEVVVLHLHEGVYLALNRTASVLWTALVDGAEEEDLTDLLVRRFDVSMASAREDVRRFLSDLRARQLAD